MKVKAATEKNFRRSRAVKPGRKRAATRRFSWRAAGFCTAAVLGAVALYHASSLVLHASTLQVQRIVVRGNVRLSSGEVQALVSTSSYGMARRMAVGIDQNRLSLLLAVLEKRAGLHLVSDDVFVNIAGGMSIDEPAVDLGIVAAVASSLRNRPIAQGTAVFGEVGLGGEVRGVAQANLRIREAEQMGFTRIVLPASNMDASEEPGKAALVGVRSVGEALDMLLV